MFHTKPISLRFGQGRMTLDLPESTRVLIGPDIPVLSNPQKATREALQNPIGSDSLRTIAERKKPESV